MMWIVRKILFILTAIFAWFVGKKKNNEKESTKKEENIRGMDEMYLHMDSENNPMVINSVMYFDELVDVDKFKKFYVEKCVSKKENRRFLQVPHLLNDTGEKGILLSLLHWSNWLKLPFVSSKWVYQPDWSIDNHILSKPLSLYLSDMRDELKHEREKLRAANGQGNGNIEEEGEEEEEEEEEGEEEDNIDRALHKLFSHLSGKAMDKRLPLWKLYLIDILDDPISHSSYTIMLTRIHHGVGDGLALVDHILDLTEPSPDPPINNHQPNIFIRNDLNQTEGANDIFLSPPLPNHNHDKDNNNNDDKDNNEDQSQKRGAQGGSSKGSSQAPSPSPSPISALSPSSSPSPPLVDRRRERRGGVKEAVKGVVKLIFLLLLLPLSLIKFLFVKKDKRSFLSRGIGGGKGGGGGGRGKKAVAWSHEIDLESVKQAAKLYNATVNDILTATASLALRNYSIDECGLNPPPLKAFIPVGNAFMKNRQKELQNNFGFILLTLPLHLTSPSTAVTFVKSQMDQLKNSFDIMIGYYLSLVESKIVAPVWLIIGSRYWTSRCSLVFSNVKGPEKNISLAGYRITKMSFFVPQAGDLGLGVSIFSYAGKVSLSILCDSSRIRNPTKLMHLWESSFFQLLRSAQ